MRILSGILKGKRLPHPPPTTRPTSERAREAIFNVLTHSSLRPEKSPFGTLKGCKILDIFSGTGALGLEALSRGAESVDFIDNCVEAIENLKQFMGQIGLQNRTHVWRMNACFLPKASGPYDIIFMDPPYGTGLEKDVVRGLECQGWLDENTLLVLETPRSSTPPSFPHWVLARSERCGIALLSFLKPVSKNFWQESLKQ